MRDSWAYQFFRLLSNPRATKNDIRHAFDIKSKNLPGTLYRYRSSEDFCIDELGNDSIFLNMPIRQNDPLDTICTVNRQELRRALERRRFSDMAGVPTIGEQLVKEHVLLRCLQGIADHHHDNPQSIFDTLIDNAPPEEQDKFSQIRQTFNRIGDGIAEDEIAFLRSMLQERVLIACFTTDHQSAPMWNHYAQSHRGLCIAYDIASFSEDDLRCRDLFPSIYRNTLFDLTIHLIANMDSEMSVGWPVLVCIHKKAEWSYEKEWRIISLPKSESEVLIPALYPFAKPAAVYLGMQMASEKEQRAVEIARRRGIAIYKMEVSHQEGRLVAVPQ